MLHLNPLLLGEKVWVLSFLQGVDHHTREILGQDGRLWQDCVPTSPIYFSAVFFLFSLSVVVTQPAFRSLKRKLFHMEL